MFDSKLIRGALTGAAFFALSLPAFAQSVPLSHRAADADKVVASRGGVQVTLGDIDSHLEEMEPAERPGFLDDPDRASRYIDQLLTAKQLTAAAVKRGLEKDPAYLDQMEVRREQLLSLAEVNAYLATLSVPDFAGAAKERYTASKESMATGGGLDVRHILILTDGVAEKDAEAKAQEVYEHARKGEDFGALVKQYSQEPDSDKRGGWIRGAGKMNLDPKFTIAMRSLKNIGDVAPPVRSKFGYHIIRLERNDPPKIPTYEEVAPKLLAEMKNKFVQTKREEYLATLTGLPVELNDELVKTLPTRHDVPRPAVPAPTATQTMTPAPAVK